MQAFSLITQQFARDTESFPAAIGVGVDSPKVVVNIVVSVKTEFIYIVLRSPVKQCKYK